MSDLTVSEVEATGTILFRFNMYQMDEGNVVGVIVKPDNETSVVDIPPHLAAQVPMMMQMLANA